jgi:hypothetical protein
MKHRNWKSSLTIPRRHRRGAACHATLGSAPRAPINLLIGSPVIRIPRNPCQISGFHFSNRRETPSLRSGPSCGIARRFRLSSARFAHPPDDSRITSHGSRFLIGPPVIRIACKSRQISHLIFSNRRKTPSLRSRRFRGVPLSPPRRPRGAYSPASSFWPQTSRMLIGSPLIRIPRKSFEISRLIFSNRHKRLRSAYLAISLRRHPNPFAVGFLERPGTHCASLNFAPPPVNSSFAFSGLLSVLVRVWLWLPLTVILSRRSTF